MKNILIAALSIGFAVSLVLAVANQVRLKSLEKTIASSPKFTEVCGATSYLSHEAGELHKSLDGLKHETYLLCSSSLELCIESLDAATEELKQCQGTAK